MEKGNISDWFFDLNTSLNETNSCLARIEERLKNFIDRVEEHDNDLEDVKRHVQTVRTVSRVASIGITVIGVLAGIAQIFR